MHRLSPSERTVPTTAGEFVARRSDVRRIALRLLPTSRSLAIVTDDARIDAYVRSTYGALVADGTSHAQSDVGALLTGSGTTEVTFNGTPLPRPNARDRNHPLNSGAYLVDQFVWRSLARDPAWLPLYGCALELYGRVIAIVGASGTGKTTLGLALMSAGARLYGDEMIVMHRSEPLVGVVGRRLAVREQTLSVLGDDRLAAVVRSAVRFRGGEERTYYVNPATLDDAFGSAPPPLPLGALIILRSRDGTTRLDPLSHGRAAMNAASYLGVRRGDLTEVAALAKLLNGAATFTATADDPYRLAALIASALAP